MRYAYLALVLVCVLTVSVFGFRGSISHKPPLEVFPDMDRQAKFRPQAPSLFFADGRADRTPPAGVVARGRRAEADPDFQGNDDHLFAGKDAKGQFARGFPAAVPVDAQLMERGRKLFTINCAPCHGRLGDGKGIVTEYGWGAPANFHQDKFRQMPEGEIFNTITNGKATMMPYADKLAPKERWAVIAYLRALQRAQNGTPGDVIDPDAKRTLGIK
jgi:mono/diheme cytochrome c family protein